MGRRKRVYEDDGDSSSDSPDDDDELPEDADLRDEAMLFRGSVLSW